MTDKIYLNTDSVYRIDGVKNSQTGAFINDATVELTLFDSGGRDGGVEIAGETWPLAGDYVAGSDGSYQFALPDSLVAEDGDTGEALITIDGDGLQTEILVDVVFEERTQVTIPWSSRQDLYNLFGKNNVREWADLDGDQVDDDIETRIQWAVENATEDARTRLEQSPVTIVSGVPALLRMATTRLAGVLLYESRGVKDTSDESGKHRLSYHRDLADKFFDKVLAGQLRLQSTDSVKAPYIVPYEDDNVSTQTDPFAGIG